MTNPTGSILLRRGPTTDRVAFVPLDGEIIYDENLKSIFVGDGATYGGNAVGAVPGTMSNSFANILVAGQSNVVADSYSDNLTLIAGTGITITTDPLADSITINSSAAGATYGISAETATGGTSLRLTGSNVTTDNVKFAEGTGITVTRTDADTITIATTITDTNTTYGVSAENVAGGAYLRLTGSNASTDNIKFASAGNVTVSRTDANTITISGSATGGAVLDDLVDVSLSVPTNGQFLRYNGTNWYNATATLGSGSLSSSFETIRVAGQPDVVADSSTDTLTLVAGPGITITSDAVTDTVTITNSNTVVSVSPNEIAAGTDQATALALTSVISNITTTDPGTGVRLPTAVAGTRVLVFNNGENVAAVYPATGAAINGLATDIAFSLEVGARLEFVAITTTQWYTMNATYA
jgi:hypothetical protein